MKRIWWIVLAAALLLTGCGASAPDPHPEWDAAWVRVGTNLGAEAPEGFTFNRENTVSSAGLYYVTWSTGEGRDVTNAQGQEVSAYDAQFYILVEEKTKPEDAQAVVEEWMAMEAESYETGPEERLTAAGQEFRILPLLKGGEDNPYHHGRAAFAVRGSNAMVVELLCVEDWPGDPDSAMEAFLQGLHYGT